jgi:hypothetical protein
MYLTVDFSKDPVIPIRVGNLIYDMRIQHVNFGLGLGLNGFGS